MVRKQAVVTTVCKVCGVDSTSVARGPWRKVAEGMWELDPGVGKCPCCGSDEVESSFDDGGLMVVEDA